MDKLSNIKQLALTFLKKIFKVLKYMALAITSFIIGIMLVDGFRYPDAALKINNTNKEIETVQSEYNQLNENIDNIKIDIEQLEQEKDEKNNKITELEQTLNSYN